MSEATLALFRIGLSTEWTKITANWVGLVKGQGHEVTVERNDSYCLVCNYVCLLLFARSFSCKDSDRDRGGDEPASGSLLLLPCNGVVVVVVGGVQFVLDDQQKLLFHCVCEC